MPSSFRISTHVPDVEAMLIWGEILDNLVFFVQLSLLFLGFLYFVVIGHQVALIPLCRNGCACGSVFSKVVENQAQPSLACEHTLESVRTLNGQKSPLLL